MSRGAKIIAGTVALAALVGLAAWLLGMQDEAGPRAAQQAAAPAADEPSAAELPVANERAAAPAALAPKPVATETPAAVAAATDAAAPAILTGRVVDANGRAVAGAIVRHMPTHWQQQKLDLHVDAFGPPLDLGRLARTQTGSDGRFSLPVSDHAPDHAPRRNGTDDPWQGSWTDVPRLLVMHPTFETRGVSCVGWRGGAFDAGDIVLVPGVALSGRAVDERGLPLAGVRVAVPAFDDDDIDDARQGEWWLVRATVRTQTGDDGRFALDGFWAGAHRLELRTEGRRAAQRAFVGLAGKPLDLGDILLEKGGVIEGVVVDAHDRPVPGARVLARPSKLLSQISNSLGDVAAQFASHVGGPAGSVVDVEVTTNERGTFRLDALEPANSPFCIYAGASGFEPVARDGVALGAAPLRLQLPVVASLVLTVVDPISRQPIAGAQVTARRPSSLGSRPQPLTVGSDPAALAAAGLAAPYVGVFLLSPAGGESNTASVTAPGRATQDFELPGVPAGERRSVTIELPLALRIAGRVLDAQRQPIADAKVSQRKPEPDPTAWKYPPDDPPEYAHASSGADGAFVLEGLAAGDCFVHAAAHGYVAMQTPMITLQVGAPVENLELVLQPAGAIAGVVLLGDQPAARAQIKLVSVAQAEAVRAAERANGGSIARKDRPPLDEHFTVTDAQGRFLFEDLSPEAFEVSGPAGALAIAEVKAGETTEITLAQHVRPRVRGHVRDAQGPVVGAAIHDDQYMDFFKSWGTTSPATHSDADGNFDFEIEAPGRYLIRAEVGKLDSNDVELQLTWDQVEWVELQMKAPKPAPSGG